MDPLRSRDTSLADSAHKNTFLGSTPTAHEDPRFALLVFYFFFQIIQILKFSGAHCARQFMDFFSFSCASLSPLLRRSFFVIKSPLRFKKLSQTMSIFISFLIIQLLKFFLGYKSSFFHFKK